MTSGLVYLSNNAAGRQKRLGLQVINEKNATYATDVLNAGAPLCAARHLFTMNKRLNLRLTALFQFTTET